MWEIMELSHSRQPYTIGRRGKELGKIFNGRLYEVVCGDKSL